MKGLRLLRPRAERGKCECRLSRGVERSKEGSRGGRNIGRERTIGRSGRKGGGRGEGEGEDVTRGRVDRLQNLAQLRADWTRCTTDQPGLPDSQYEVSRQISCTSASEHTSPGCIGRPSSPPPPPFIAGNLGFPSVVLPSARPFADCCRINNNL